MKKAFTLIELIVVIAIIVILAWMIIPALKKAKNVLTASKEIPKITQRVTDFTGTLSQEQIASLIKKLDQHEAETSNQLAVVILKSLEGNNIEKLSIDIAKKGFGGKGLGQEGKDNGVLILLAIEEREFKIEVGYGLEGVLPDGMCGRIMDEEIAPYFKQEDYYSGFNNGIDKIILAIRGEYTGSGRPVSGSGDDSGGEETSSGLIVILLFGLFIVSAFLCVVHRILGSLSCGIGAFFIVNWLYSLPLAIIAGLIGLFVGAVSKEILEGAASSEGGGSYSSGGSRYSGRSHSSRNTFSGGGGKFGGGGASRRF